MRPVETKRLAAFILTSGMDYVEEIYCWTFLGVLDQT
jgi:hypothetical protein